LRWAIGNGSALVEVSQTSSGVPVPDRALAQGARAVGVMFLQAVNAFAAPSEQRVCVMSSAVVELRGTPASPALHVDLAPRPRHGAACVGHVDHTSRCNEAVVAHWGAKQIKSQRVSTRRPTCFPEPPCPIRVRNFCGSERLLTTRTVGRFAETKTCFAAVADNRGRPAYSRSPPLS
jgi:hypothetical protein